MRINLTASFVRSILDFDAKTGVFTWRPGYHRSVVAGRVAGRVNGKGYATISIKNNHYQSHRLAWLHFYGEWPSGQIDHINRNKLDNSIKNLRVVTASENCLNRDQPKSKYSNERGVTFHKSNNKWQAQICLPGRNGSTYIGSFESKEDAVLAYKEARRSLL